MRHPPPLVALRSVSRAYDMNGLIVPAVKDVSLDVHHSEMVAIMGPSGSGKSTLMNMIGLLDVPSSGSVHLDGVDVAEFSEARRSELRASSIGFVFQSYNLLARHDAIENVALPLVYCGVPRKERQLRAAQSLEAVGMLHRAGYYPRQLSGGEQQRVALARAIVTAPLVILADEPTGALDSRTGREIMALLRSLNRAGQTVVLITHDASVAAQCRRTITLCDGAVVADNPTTPEQNLRSVPNEHSPRSCNRAAGFAP